MQLGVCVYGGGDFHSAAEWRTNPLEKISQSTKYCGIAKSLLNYARAEIDQSMGGIN